jgi:dimeric dUTPase (all-alpha-NTP-PPase superfamily)
LNLNELFEIQAKLDAHIEKEHPRQPGEDRLAEKILALQVELGELANEWRGFKYWSKDQEPRTEVPVKYYSGGPTEIENWLLEEYVDCLHFILSIGLDLKLGGPYVIGTYKGPNIIRQFNFVYQDVSKLDVAINEDWEEGEIFEQYDELVRGFLGLGEMLGFTWDQVEQAYLAKNKVNHERQEYGY